MELTVVLISNGTAYHQGPVLDITLRVIECDTSYQLKGTLFLRFSFVILRYPTSHEDRVTLEDAQLETRLSKKLICRISWCLFKSAIIYYELLTGII